MKSLPWIVGVVMIGLTLLAVAVIPRELPPTPPGSPRAPGDAATNAALTPGAPRPFRAIWNAVEQISAIVGDDGALVESLGIETPGGVFRPIIRRGEQSPVTRSFTIATAMENQTEMLVHVCRGNAERAADNESLGWFRIGGIPPGPASTTYIALILRVADDAIIGAAVMQETGRNLRFGPTDSPRTR